MEKENNVQDVKEGKIRDVYIVGSKSIGMYGGYESFVRNLLQQHKNNKLIRYHVACKANGQGHMKVEELSEAHKTGKNEFEYCNAQCFLIKVPEKIGAAQAIYYDLSALKWVCKHIEENDVHEPIVYILASRVGPFEKRFVKRIHNKGGLVYQNPDGHEDWRRKWNYIIRKYWKISEKYAVKNADLVVCDSKNIETYIRDEYSLYKPNTTFIAYGADVSPSKLTDDDSKYVDWLKKNDIVQPYYVCISRFVEENNYEIMIREFMKSNTKRDFVIIATDNPKFAEQLQQKYNYKSDKRIKFVGTVYDAELLKKIRENAYGYLHGHEVGGTNPSLLEALGSTKLNLLYDVGFNREVAEDAALYWNKGLGDLAELIDTVDKFQSEQLQEMGGKAQKRIKEEYSWPYICQKYERIFVNVDVDTKQ